jgi:hypothetical protein
VKTIHIEAFDKKSVEQAIKELNSLKAEWQRKANLCAETIAAMLADEIQKNLDPIPMTDDLIDIKTHTPVPRNTYAYSYAQGNRVYIKGQEIAFIEFGAGIYHNSSTNNPLSDAVSFNTTIGSYGKGQGVKPYWFVAHNLISHGTPAYMPIQHAIEAVTPQIPTIVRQIFV